MNPSTKKCFKEWRCTGEKENLPSAARIPLEWADPAPGCSQSAQSTVIVFAQ